MMSNLQDSLKAASAMPSPSASIASVSPHSLHLARHSMAIQSPLFGGLFTKKRTPLSNHVRFNDQISGVIVPSLDDIPIKERKNIWYSLEEKAHLQANLKNEAKHMRRCMSRSVSPESDHTSSRGIEHLASGAILRDLDNAKAAVIRAVLLEQQHQRMTYGGNYDDGHHLAMMSSELSIDARKRAIVLAISDQEFVLTCNQYQKHEDYHVASASTAATRRR